MTYQLLWVISCLRHSCRQTAVVYLTHSWGNKRVHTFHKGITPKVNAIAWLVFQLNNYDITVQHISHLPQGHPKQIGQRDFSIIIKLNTESLHSSSEFMVLGNANIQWLVNNTKYYFWLFWLHCIISIR